jgi:hypothetical protein
LAYRLRDKFIRFVEKKYSKYLYDFKNIDDIKSDSIAREWKKAILDFYETKFSLKNYFRFVPDFLKEGIDKIVFSFLSEFISQLFKDFIPYLVEKYKIHNFIETVDLKTDITVLSGYFYKYYRYVLLISLIIGFVIGFINASLFVLFA